MSESKSDELLAEARRVFVRSFAGDFALPVIARAQGATITDVDGREYLDFSSGQMCATVGHNHPRIAEAVRDAADRALHINSAMLSSEVIALGRRVVELLPPPLDKVFFLSTGGESNEAALKIAKKVTGRYEVVGLAHSDRGRRMREPATRMRAHPSTSARSSATPRRPRPCASTRSGLRVRAAAGWRSWTGPSSARRPTLEPESGTGWT